MRLSPLNLVWPALVCAACGILPSAPDPLPTDFVPDIEVTLAADPGSLSPDGFTAAQRMTVRVRNVGCGFISTGSGFALDEHTLVTNRHVIESSRELELSTYDGETLTATASSVATISDIAMVRTDESLTTSAVLAEHDPSSGDSITVVGYPGGGRLTTVSGIVLQATEDPLGGSLGTVYATTARVEPGSSGSPVLNDAGEIVGVIYAKNEAEQSFMIPVSTLRDLLEQPGLVKPQETSCAV